MSGPVACQELLIALLLGINRNTRKHARTHARTRTRNAHTHANTQAWMHAQGFLSLNLSLIKSMQYISYHFNHRLSRGLVLQFRWISICIFLLISDHQSSHWKLQSHISIDLNPANYSRIYIKQQQRKNYQKIIPSADSLVSGMIVEKSLSQSVS